MYEQAVGDQIPGAQNGFTGIMVGDVIFRHFPNKGEVRLHNWIDNPPTDRSRGYTGPSKAVVLNLKALSGEQRAELIGLLQEATDEADSRDPQPKRKSPARKGRKLVA